MARLTSPLRYPGGKTGLYPLVSRILQANGLERRDYAEPFAGGCGLALTLLFEGHVSDIHVNDIDVGVWSFWKSVLDDSDSLAAMIATTPVTIDEWHRQREIHARAQVDDPLLLGFATFFLNRTNRSGVIKGAGVIGGLDQSGPYKIDCRFNREDLVRRIRRVAKYRGRIHLSRLDARQFPVRVSGRLPARTFLCVDPPYYRKGASLYTSFYQPADHAMLAEALLAAPSPWIATYDNEPDIRTLYRTRRTFLLDVNYSMATKRVGTELLIASKGLRLPAKIWCRGAT